MNWQELHTPLYGGMKLAAQPDKYTSIRFHFWRVIETDAGDRLEYMTPSGTVLPADTFSFVSHQP